MLSRGEARTAAPPYRSTTAGCRHVRMNAVSPVREGLSERADELFGGFGGL